jgi:predicted phosphodiesterase
MHFGHPNFREDLLDGYIKWILKHEAWVILMGDLVENSTRASVGSGVYEQTIPPSQQIDLIEKKLQPLVDKGLVLGTLTGNHEQRTLNLTSLDPTKILAKIWGVPYLKYGGFFYLRVGNQTYSIYATHGSTGAATSGGKLQAATKLALGFDADIYLMGHVHDLLTDQAIKYRYNPKRKTVEQIRKTFVVTGSYLDHAGSYAQMKTYQPSKLGSPRIRLSGVEKDVHVNL